MVKGVQERITVYYYLHMNMTKPTAYSYVRFSSAEQGKGASRARQTELAEAYAKQHGLNLSNLTFEDLNSSGYTQENIAEGGALKAFIDGVEEGTILPGSYLLVESLDRISRGKILSAVTLLMQLINLNIVVVTLSDGNVFRSDGSDHFGPLMMAVVTFYRANEESEIKSRRIRDAWSRKRARFAQDGNPNIGKPKKRITSVCPAWLKLNEDETEFDFIPEKRVVVEEIIQMTMSGLGKTAIANQLNARGVPTISPPKVRRSPTYEVVGSVNPDRIWQESYITKVIKNRALIGEFQPHKTVDGKRVPVGDPIKNYFPRLITDEEFALLQDVISERGRKSGGRRGRTFANLFTGLVKCGYCGSTMVFVDKGIDKRGNRDQAKNRFLICSKARRKAMNRCHAVTWTYSEFEEAFFKNASRSDFTRFIATTNDRGAEIKALHNQVILDRAKLEQLELEQARCLDALKSAARTPQILVDELNRIEDSKDELKASIEAAEMKIQSARAREVQTESALDALRQIHAELGVKDGEESFAYRARLNEHMRRIIQQINLYPGGTIETPESIQKVRDELIESNEYPLEHIDAIVKSMMRTTPDKGQRYFTIKNRDQVLQVLHPEADVPDLINALAHSAGVAAHIHKRTQERLILGQQNEQPT
ncbi:MAG: recombinase family protein [Acidovorax temperans]|uniref:recombinase family protein n=1 Tax=Acidovorax temperans TaxID=80878 RepID=UPI00391CA164